MLALFLPHGLRKFSKSENKGPLIMKVKALLFTATCFVGAPATAGVITQYTGFDNFAGTCPGASSPTYLNDWGPAVAYLETALQGPTSVSDLTFDSLCLFNRNRQAQFYNPDGTLTTAGLDNGFPDLGVPYNPQDVGTLSIDTTSGTSSTISGDLTGKAYGSMILDSANLGLPEIKLLANADQGDRLSVNGFAATEFLWTGGTELLSFDINFDFYGSNNQLCVVNGGPCMLDSALYINAGVSIDMIFDVNQAAISNILQPAITQDSYIYEWTDLGRAGSTAQNPIQGSLSLNFEVNNGDQFFLWAGAQAFAIDGGFLNAANTITTDLRLAGDDNGTASQELFARALQPAPPTPVNAPATLALFGLGLAALGYSRRKKV
jgi:hypothetical protein